MKKSVALIFGGEGCERDISLISARNLYRLIDKSSYSVLPVWISGEGSWYALKDMPSADTTRDIPRDIPTYPVRIGEKSGFLINGSIGRIDIALPLLHGDLGEDGRIQGALDAAHIPYVGCDVFASALCADKIYTKIIAESLGIPTARWIWSDGADMDDSRRQAEASFGYPMFIKPARLGSSIGAEAVRTEAEFERAFRAAAVHGRILIEELVPVKYEVECAFLGLSGEKLISASGTVDTEGAFYDYKAKYFGENSPKTSHGAPHTAERETICSMARALADLLGLRHFARLDFFLTRGGEIYFNEINTIPGMTKTSLYPSLTEDMGLESGEFINRLLAELTG